MKYNNKTGKYDFENKMEELIGEMKLANYQSPEQKLNSSRNINNQLYKQRDQIERTNKVVNAVLSGVPLTSKEVENVFFVEEPSELLSRINIRHSLSLDLPVLGLDNNNNIEVRKVVSLDGSKSERVVIPGIPDSFFVYKDKSYNVDLVNAMINDGINEKLDNKVIEILNTTTLSVTSTGALTTDLVSAIKLLSKKNKKNITILISPEDYILNSSILNNITDIDILITAGITNIYVGNLSTITLNYTTDKWYIGKDDFKKGLKAAACTLYNLDGAILDEASIVKIAV